MVTKNNKVTINLPNSIFEWLGTLGIPKATYCKNLVIESYKSSKFAQISLNNYSIEVTKIDLTSNNVTFELPEELRKVLNTKIKKVVLKL